MAASGNLSEPLAVTKNALIFRGRKPHFAAFDLEDDVAMGDKNPKKQMKKAAPKKVAPVVETLTVKPGQKGAPKPAQAKR